MPVWAREPGLPRALWNKGWPEADQVLRLGQHVESLRSDGIEVQATVGRVMRLTFSATC